MNKGQRSSTGFVLQLLPGDGSGATGKEGFGMKRNKFLRRGWWRCRGGEIVIVKFPIPWGRGAYWEWGSGFVAAGTEHLGCGSKI